MADLADVENALKAIIVAAAYPSGTAQPSALPSATPLACERGWPNKEELKADMGAGRALVSILKRPGERNTTRFPADWQRLAPGAPTITAVVNIAAGTVTLGGTVSTPQNVAVVLNDQPFVYGVQAGDTLAQIASALVALIDEGEFVASSVGAVITIEGVSDIVARADGYATVGRELERQERQVTIRTWAPTPELRDSAAGFVKAVMAGKGLARPRDFITLADGFAAKLTYAGSMQSDDNQVEGNYFSDLFYMVDYPTTETTTAPETVGFGIEVERE